MTLTRTKRAEISTPNSLKPSTNDAKLVPPKPTVPVSAPPGVHNTPYAAATPKIHNMLYDDEKHEHVDFLIEGDIQGAIFRDLQGLDKVKIPDAKLPFKVEDVNRKLADDKSLHSGSMWKGWPAHLKNEGTPEVMLAKLMNDIGAFIAGSENVSTPRKWTSRYANKGVPDGRCERKPDVVLMDALDADAERAPNWSRIYAVVELKVAQKPEQDPVEQLAQYARLIFGKQPDRRFVLGITIISTQVNLVVFNRAGLFVSDSFNAHQQSERLIRVVAMMYLDREHLGFDPTFEYTPVDGKASRTITVSGETYQVQDILYIESVICGRGTVCLSVNPENDKRNLVVKNSWVDVERKQREPKMLEELEDVPGISKLHNSETLSYRTRLDFDNLPSATGLFVNQRASQSARMDNREQVRVVLSPLGTSMMKMKSVHELLWAIIGIVEAIKELTKRKYVHRDISLRNIMLGDLENERSERNGVLIDFDYAIKQLSDRIAASAERTGTLPFMAIELLRSVGNFEHEYHHDLESLFYVLCYICSACAGPGKDGKKVDISEKPIAGWFGKEGEKFGEIGGRKILTVESDEAFQESILSNLQPAFNQLKPCLEGFRKLVIPPQKSAVTVARQYFEATGFPIVFELTEMKSRDPQVFFAILEEVLWRAYLELPDEPPEDDSVEGGNGEETEGEDNTNESGLVGPNGERLAERARELRILEEANNREAVAEGQLPLPTLRFPDVERRERQLAQTWAGPTVKRKSPHDDESDTLVAQGNLAWLERAFAEPVLPTGPGAPDLEAVPEEAQRPNSPLDPSNKRRKTD